MGKRRNGEEEKWGRGELGKRRKTTSQIEILKAAVQMSFIRFCGFYCYDYSVI